MDGRKATCLVGEPRSHKEWSQACNSTLKALVISYCAFHAARDPKRDCVPLLPCTNFGCGWLASTGTMTWNRSAWACQGCNRKKKDPEKQSHLQRHCA
jgi:hypothetical protein